MAKVKRWTVETRKDGLNLREGPGMNYPIVRVLPNGEKISLTEEETPEGWVAVKGGGYVMREFLK